MLIDLTVVIPAFNEAHRLEPTLEAVAAYCGQRRGTFELVVVDDGSTDETASLVERFVERFADRSSGTVRLLRQPRNLGKGAAVRRGVLASRGRRVLYSDADHSIPISQLDRLEERLEAGAAIAIASRALPTSTHRTHQPVHRRWMGRTFNRVLRTLGATELRDTQCGFKLFDGEIGRSLFRRMTVDGFAFDVELLFLARRQGLRVDEVGVECNDARGSHVDPLRDPLRMLRDVALLSWRHR